AFLPQVETLDITGGAPELHPQFRSLVSRARGLGKHVIDRCNLTILQEPGQADLARFLAAARVEIIASLPCYTPELVDRQRGSGDVPQPGVGRLAGRRVRLRLQPDARGAAGRAAHPPRRVGRRRITGREHRGSRSLLWLHRGSGLLLRRRLACLARAAAGFSSSSSSCLRWPRFSPPARSAISLSRTSRPSRPRSTPITTPILGKRRSPISG